MKGAVGYIRVSTLEQAKDGYSIKAQENKIRAYAFAKEITLSRVYIDDGYSGSNLNRPGIKELLSNLQDIDCVIVYKLDRLSRSQKEILYLVEDVFIKKSIDFISINETFDTSTSYGRAMIGMLAVFSQLERENIIQRSILGKEQRAKEGKFKGGISPLGYDYLDGSLIVNNDEANIVRLIYGLYSRGYGYNAISRYLKNNQYRGKRGGTITPTKVKSILSNGTYIGFIPYKGNLYKSNHEPIITEELFNNTKGLLNFKSQMYVKKSDKFDVKPYSGLLYCGLCGARIFKRSIKKKDYYTCYTYHGSPSHMMTSDKCSLGLLDFNTVANMISDKLRNMDITSIKSKDSTWDNLSISDKQIITRRIVHRVLIYPDRVDLMYR